MLQLVWHPSFPITKNIVKAIFTRVLSTFYVQFEVGSLTLKLHGTNNNIKYNLANYMALLLIYEEKPCVVVHHCVQFEIRED